MKANAGKRVGRVNLRVPEAEAQAVKALAESSGMSQSAVASMIWAAAIEAVREHGCPLPFPLKLKVAG